MNEVNRKAFLDMIADSEGTINLGDNGYNVIVGGSLFDDYSDHPRKLVKLNEKLKSTAAGRYQILARYYDAYKGQLNLPDFSPSSQDKIAIQMIKECRVLDAIDNGKIELAISKCSSRWASFPGAGYGQHENRLSKLITAYLKYGGKLEVT